MSALFLSWLSPEKYADVCEKKISDETQRSQSVCQLEVKQGLNVDDIYFRGVITNQRDIIEQLKLTNVDHNELLKAAISKWGNSFNQYVIGDYVLLWLNAGQVTMTSSACSTHTLFWLQEDCLKISSQLSDITRKNILLDEVGMLQRLVFGFEFGNKTHLAKVKKLLPGETLCWSVEKTVTLEYQNQLERVMQIKQVNSYALPLEFADKVDPSEVNGAIEKNHLFSSMPQIAYRLGEPLLDATLVEFSWYLSRLSKSTASHYIHLDDYWLRGRTRINIQSILNDRCWTAAVAKRLKKNTSKLKLIEKQLKDEYENAELSKRITTAPDSLSFAQWFDLNYAMPAYCQILQRVALLHGKTLVFPSFNPQVARELILNNSHEKEEGYFCLSDPGIYNVYDAAQRLFYSGAGITKKIFSTAPISLVQLIKQFSIQPQRTEQSCIQLITFDYLAKFNAYQMKS